MRSGDRFTMAWLLLLGVEYVLGRTDYLTYPAICCYLYAAMNRLNYGTFWAFP